MGKDTTHQTPEEEMAEKSLPRTTCSRSIAARRVTTDPNLPKYVVPFDVAEEIERELIATQEAFDESQSALVVEIQEVERLRNAIRNLYGAANLPENDKAISHHE